MHNKHYWQRYKKLIAYCRARKLKAKYTEMHHIMPKSLGGSDAEQNLIKLSAREHYIAHWILAKCFTKKTHKRKMQYAFWAMVTTHKQQRKLTARQFDRARLIVAKANSSRDYNAEAIEKGITTRKTNNAVWHTEETKAKIGKANKHTKKCRGKEHYAYGKKRKLKTRLKISAKLTNNIFKVQYGWYNAELNMSIYCSAWQLSKIFSLQTYQMSNLCYKNFDKRSGWAKLYRD